MKQIKMSSVEMMKIKYFHFCQIFYELKLFIIM